MQDKSANFLSLFASSSTLICCALPSLFIAIGAGASFASLITVFPFKKDTNVKKVDVDLSKGKVLIAYNVAHEIIFDDIKEKILINGQNAIDMQVINL